MRIGIDCSCVAKPERTGVARYCDALLGELPSVIGPDDRVTLLYRFSRLKRRRWFETVDDPRFRVALFDDRLLPLGPRGLDVVHGPDLRIPRLGRVPAVSTVHDLSALQLPGIAKESFRKRKSSVLETVARRARIILCISEFTEKALVERFPAAIGRTRVVPLGLSPRFRRQDQASVDQVRREMGLAPRYLLFVGQISARKNLDPLLSAFNELHRDPRFSDVDLVLAGPVQTGGEEIVQQAQASFAAEHIKFPGFVTDGQLAPLYAGATVFCFLGKGEGFGLPILEAMACGCPVVVGRAGANISTAGDAARRVDPDNPADLLNALEEMLLSKAKREEWVAAGLTRADEFSWRVTARRTVEAYREAALAGAMR